MKKIFIDCGTHFFQGFKDFAKNFNIDDTWECYSFEANPITYNRSKYIYKELTTLGFNIDHRNLAVSDSDGYIKINCDLAEDGTGQGSNILIDPPNKDKLWGHELNYIDNDINVEKISLVDFIDSVYSEGDYILIKLDVEGSEFSIIDSLIDKEKFSMTGLIYVEFHERFFENEDLYLEKIKRYKDIFEDKNIKLLEWR